MKKYLFLLLSILSIFFITDRVEALSFTASNGKEYTVDSEEKLLDYCYYTYVKDKQNMVVFGKYNNEYFCSFYGFQEIYKVNVAIYSTAHRLVITNIKNNSTSSWSGYRTTDFSSFSSTYSNSRFTNLLYSNVDIYIDSTYTDLYLSSNFPVEDIEKRYGIIPTYKITYYVNNLVYKELEVEEGTSHDLDNYSYNSDMYNFSGWTVEDNKDLTNITSNIVIRATLEEKAVTPVYIKNISDFPIQKTEFYALLVLLGSLIIMLFLKWCFPFKGGSDLK